MARLPATARSPVLGSDAPKLADNIVIVAKNDACMKVPGRVPIAVAKSIPRPHYLDQVPSAMRCSKISIAGAFGTVSSRT